MSNLYRGPSKDAILVSDWLISKKKSSPLFKRKITLFKYRYLYSKCSYLYTDIADFLNPALALLGQGLKKSPIGQKLDFANHPYLCKFYAFHTTLINDPDTTKILNFHYFYCINSRAYCFFKCR
jgi:hypothetical protein